MKKFSQINESVSVDKEPIVEIDVVEFKNKFINNSERWKRFNFEIQERTINRLNQLVRENPTMTDDWSLHCIYNADDYGRGSGSPIIIVKAVNNEHARLKAAIILENRDFFITGFYTPVEINDVRYKEMIDDLEERLGILKNPK
jgi:hypothetical protein